MTGGLYRTQEPVQRNLADLRLLAIPSSRLQIAEGDLYWEDIFFEMFSYEHPKIDIFIVANV